MHYKNGRLAKENDQVIHQLPAYTGTTPPLVYPAVAGVIHTLTAGSDTCNAQLTVIVPGTVSNRCVNIRDCLHAEDAMHAYDAVAATVVPQNAGAVPPS